MKLLKKDIIITAVLAAVLIGLSTYKIIVMRNNAYIAITEKNAAVINDALAVYRGDHEGKCPGSLKELVPHYIHKLPAHFDSTGGKKEYVKIGKYNEVDGNGGWLFVYDEGDQYHCQVFVNEIIVD